MAEPTAARGQQKNRYRETVVDRPALLLSEWTEDAHRIINEPNNAEEHWQQEMLADFAEEALRIKAERDALREEVRDLKKRLGYPEFAR